MGYFDLNHCSLLDYRDSLKRKEIPCFTDVESTAQVQLYSHVTVNLFLGWHITEEQLEDAAEKSGVFQSESGGETDLERRCKTIISDPSTIKSHECANAFLYLKEKHNEQ